jgi:hypothetical protein
MHAPLTAGSPTSVATWNRLFISLASSSSPFISACPESGHLLTLGDLVPRPNRRCPQPSLPASWPGRRDGSLSPVPRYTPGPPPWLRRCRCRRGRGWAPRPDMLSPPLTVASPQPASKSGDAAAAGDVHVEHTHI